MSVLRYYGCTDFCIRILGSLVCNIRFISDLCLVLCFDIYRSTLISIMYPACMITVHDRKSRVLQIETLGTTFYSIKIKKYETPAKEDPSSFTFLRFLEL